MPLDRRGTSGTGEADSPGPGVRLVATFGGHTGGIGRPAWSPDGALLASPSFDGSVGLWDVRSGGLVRSLPIAGQPCTTAFDRTGQLLAVGHLGGTVSIWLPATGELVQRIDDEEHRSLGISAVTFTATGALVIVNRGLVRIWDPTEGVLRHRWSTRAPNGAALAAHPTRDLVAVADTGGDLRLIDSSGTTLGRTSGDGEVQMAAAFSPDDELLTAAFLQIEVYALGTVRPVHVIEGHTQVVTDLAFSADGRILASRSYDGTTRLWDASGWGCVGVVPGPASDEWLPGVAFHPSEPLLAVADQTPDGAAVVQVYRLDPDVLLGAAATPEVRYSSAKIVLVGESGVGKTGLGWRLSHGEFRQHASTHGQQVWLLDELGATRADGAQCEAILWDLAGQPDYRLIHALFLDDADLALVVFDPTSSDPLRAVDYWLRQLRVGAPDAPAVILVAGRVDRGGLRLSYQEIQAYCRRRGIATVVTTSALTGQGLPELVAAMKAAIDWEERPSTITTQTFKAIKRYVLSLKESDQREHLILTPARLRARLEHDGVAEGFTDAEMMTAVGHLANHGYVTWLRAPGVESSVLLAPELLNNLAASIVLEARRNARGLGSLDERALLAGELRLPELDGLDQPERELLLDCAVAMFLSHNVCFRSVDPLSNRSYLVFPELINRPRPSLEDDVAVEEAISYAVTGATENLYASVAVVLGYTSTFTRTDRWRNHARYVMGDAYVCDLRVESRDDGELLFIISFGLDVPGPARSLFQSLVENLLDRPDLVVRRFPQIICGQGHRLPRAVLQDRQEAGFAFCPGCGERLELPRPDTSIVLTDQQAETAAAHRRVADDRSRFEEAVFRLTTYLRREGPRCFISYAWGDPAQEHWVEYRLAEDLAKAGIQVILDRWDLRPGTNLPRFIERVLEAERVVVVGTPAYRTKYVNNEPMRGFGVAAEGDLIGARMIGTEQQKASVVPVLLAGDPTDAFPPLLQGRVYVDFRDADAYFTAVFDLILGLYGIDPRNSAVAELRREIAGALP